MTSAVASRLRAPKSPQFSRMDKAKVAIVAMHPFFASILMRRTLIEDFTIPTAGVDARGQIYYNPDFVAKLSVDQLVFLLCHEVLHVVGQHASRLFERDRKRWNIATDAWINDVLREQNIGEFIEGGVNMPGSKDKTTDDIYNALPEEQGGGGQGQGQGNGVGGCGDDLLERGKPMTNEEQERHDAEMRVEIAQAAQAAKAQGKLEGKLAEIVAGLIEVKTPWYEILERRMTNFTRGDYTWSRPSRRFIGQGMYLPTVGSIAKMGEMVIQVDVSGSINKQELAVYNGQTSRIVSQCSPERVHVLYVDTHVCKHDIFEQGEEVSLEFYSGGGTDMVAGLDYIEEEGIAAEVVVVLTDGYFSSSASQEPSFPVVWCITSDKTPAFGEVIRCDLSNP